MNRFKLNRKKTNNASEGISGTGLSSAISSEQLTAWQNNEEEPSSGIMTEVESRAYGSASTKKKMKPLPLIGRLSYLNQKKIAYACAGLSGIALFANIIFTNFDFKNSHNIQSSASQLILLFSNAKQQINSSIVGDNDSLNNLQKIAPMITDNIEELSVYSDSSNEIYVNTTKKYWTNLKQSVDAIQTNLNYFVNMQNNLNLISDQADKLSIQVNNTIPSLLQAGVSAGDVANLYQLNSALVRISKNAKELTIVDRTKNVKPASDIFYDNQFINKKIDSLISGSNNDALSTLLKDVKNSYLPISNIATNIVNNIAVTNKLGIENQQINKIANNAIDNLNSLLTINQSLNSSKDQRDILTITAAIIFVLSIMLLFIIINRQEKASSLSIKELNSSTRSSLNKLKRDIEIIAGGNLTHNIAIEPNDRLDEYKSTFNMVFDRIKGTLNDLSLEVEQVYVYEKNARNSVAEISKDYKYKLAGIQNDFSDSKKINELNIKESLSNYKQKLETVGENVKEIYTESKKSQKVVYEMQKELENAETRISRLEESSKKVQELVNVLTEMSERTSVLAIQSAIKSAKHAGNAGSGFQIISQEIKEIAERIDTNVKKIGALSDTTHADIVATKTAIENLKNGTTKNALFTDITSNKINTIQASNLQQSVLNEELLEKAQIQKDLLNNIENNIVKMTDFLTKKVSEIKKVEDCLDESNQHLTNVRRHIETYKINENDN